MTSYKSRKVRAALLKKGFRQANSDHFFYVYYHNGQQTGINTKISMGANHDINESLVSHMKRQLSLTKDEFSGVIECHIDEKKLSEIYESKKILVPYKLSVN